MTSLQVSRNPLSTSSLRPPSGKDDMAAMSVPLTHSAVCHLDVITPWTVSLQLHPQLQ